MWCVENTSFSIPVDEAQPSQLYLDAAKLQRAIEWFDFDDPTYEPIPVLTLDNELVLSDGHTRAFLAYLSGETALDVVPEPDREELSTDLYRECVNWCYEEDVTAIADFAGRVLNHDTFLDEWVSRCRESPLYEED
ncbi:histone acetyltransferase [Haloferax sp. S1W]|uniref:histone acetyltransferase n=1 Tax=Haloferax sp. S1W TaxID=3377110 RepID=UPI0037C99B1A